jgi:hypothetical protein
MQVTRRHIGFPGFDLRLLIDNVAAQFAAEHEMAVSAAARRKLLEPALPHVDDLQRQVAAGKVKVAVIQDALTDVLLHALDISRTLGTRTIDADAIAQAMSRSCKYFPWC